MCLDIARWGPSMKGDSYPPDLLAGMQLKKLADSR